MIIGHHILYGKVQVLDKPLVTIKKKQPESCSMLVPPGGGGEEEMMDLDSEMEAKTEYEVKSIIRKKIIFKT